MNLRSARAKLALRYSCALCLVAALVVGGLYLALSRAVDVDPPESRTVSSTTPDGSFVSVDTEERSDVEGLVEQRTLNRLRDSSLVALVGLFGMSLVVGWVVAGRVLAPIEQAMVAQRRFVQDASHELRNPLAVMRTTLDVALEDPATPPSTWRTVGGGVRDSVDRMATVVDGLLRTARDENPPSTVVTFDPAAVVRRAVAQVDALAATSVATEPARVSGDPAAVERVLANLLDNAVRHASAVAVAGARESGHYAIRVTDDGPGIPDGEVTAVFTRGHRAPDSPGQGLGLAIAQEIVESHDGTITVERTGPTGTTFLVTLPTIV